MTEPTPSRPAAAMAYAEVFQHTDAVIDKFHQWIDRDLPSDDSWWGLVKAAILLRAFNQYRSIVNLLRNNHWEDALILVRSLFELLLNTEELCRRTDDIEGAAESFAAYGHLQKYLHWREVELYHVLTRGAGPEAQGRVEEMDRLARTFFASFWETKKGRGRWRETWSRKKVWDLCTLSTNPMRPHQYRLLYGRGSEFTHSSPVAVFAAMHLTNEPEELTKLTEVTDAREEKELREVAGIASVFLFEIACFIGDRLPDFDPLWLANAGLGHIGKILGAPVPFPLRPPDVGTGGRQ